MPGQHDHGGAQAQGGGARADPRQEIQGRGDLTEAGEVMLDDEGAVVAERLGLDVILHEFSEARAAVDVGSSASGLGATKQSKPHALVLPGPALWSVRGGSFSQGRADRKSV